MDICSALLDSWDRQARIVNVVAERVTESNQSAQPSSDGMTLLRQLEHIHRTRTYFLGQLSEKIAAQFRNASEAGQGIARADLETVKSLLKASAVAVHQAVQEALESERQEAGWYDNPILYLQHMVWHEGWHVGLIMLALRLAGEEPPEEWEDAHIWGEWRTEVW